MSRRASNGSAGAVYRSATERGGIRQRNGEQIRAAVGAPRWEGGAFASPIVLPDGGQLRDLTDACDFLRGLSPVQRAAPRWRAAVNAVRLVCDFAGPPDFARAFLQQALSAASNATHDHRLN